MEPPQPALLRARRNDLDADKRSAKIDGEEGSSAVWMIVDLHFQCSATPQ